MSKQLIEFVNYYNGKSVHIVATVDDPQNIYQVISIEVSPFKSGKHAHFHVRLYRPNDISGDPVKREDIALTNEGHLCWRNDLEHIKGSVSWIEMISEVAKVYVKENGEWIVKEWLSPDCAICYKNWGVDMNLPCGHLFCKRCIMQWAKVNNTCPCCRHEFVVKFNTTHDINVL